MDDVQALVDAFINPEHNRTTQTQAFDKIGEKITSNAISLQNLVAALGEHLTSMDEIRRSRATLLLSQCLSIHSSWDLPKTSVQYLMQFFSDRLLDFPCQHEVLLGIKAVLTSHQITPGDDHRICRAIFSEVHVQSMPQATREVIFDILLLLVEKYPQSMQGLKADFVFGFIQALDGEKDPRILLDAFKLVTIIVKNFPEFTKFEEDLFEVTSCYFPITFTARPNDPDKITKEGLQSALRDALSSTPNFAPYALPLLLEKLIREAAPEVKVDTLVTLAACLKGYGATASLPFVEDIWSSLRSEIMDGTNTSVIEKAFLCLHDLVEVLDSTSSTSSHGMEIEESTATKTTSNTKKETSSRNSSLERLLLPCIQQCHHQLVNYDSKLSLLASRILQTCCEASYTACSQIISTTVPLVLTQIHHQSTETTNNKRLILTKILNGFTWSTARYKLVNSGIKDTAASSATSPLYIVQTIESHPIYGVKGNLYDVCINLLNSPQALKEEKIEAMWGLSGLGTLLEGRILDTTQILHVINLLAEILLVNLNIEHTTSSNTAKDLGIIGAAKKALVALAPFHSQSFNQQAIPKLTQSLIQHYFFSEQKKKLQIQKKNNEDEDDWILSTKRVMEVLHDLATASPFLFNHIIKYFVNFITEGESYNDSNNNNGNTNDNKDDKKGERIVSALDSPELTTLLMKAISHCFVVRANALQESRNSAPIVQNLPEVDWSTTTKFSIQVLFHLVRLAIISSCNSNDCRNESFEVLASHLPEFAANITCQIPPDLQLPELITNFLKIFIESDTNFILQLPPLSRDQSPTSQVALQAIFCPFSASANSRMKRLIPLFASVVSAHDKSIQLPNCEAIIDSLIHTILSPTSQNLTSGDREIICRSIAALLNKTQQEPVLDDYLTKMVENTIMKLLAPIESTSTRDLSLQKHASQLLVWSTKAFIMRGHKQAQKLWEHMQSLLNTEKFPLPISMHTAQNMGVLFQDVRVLSNVRSLYKQKYFTMHLPALLESFKKSNGAGETVYLIAISNLLKYIPTEVLIQELPNLLPVLLQAIKVSSTTSPTSSTTSSTSSTTSSSSTSSTTSTSSTSSPTSSTSSSTSSTTSPTSSTSSPTSSTSSSTSSTSSPTSSTSSSTSMMSSTSSSTPMATETTTTTTSTFSSDTTEIEGEEKGSMRIATVNMFIMLIQEVPDKLVDHLGTLVPSLLHFATNSQFPMKLRKGALVCLAVLTYKIPFVKLQPHKEMVIRQLKKALDDRKRQVRHQAVKARNLWFTIGFTGGTTDAPK